MCPLCLALLHVVAEHVSVQEENCHHNRSAIDPLVEGAGNNQAPLGCVEEGQLRPMLGTGCHSQNGEMLTGHPG